MEDGIRAMEEAVFTDDPMNATEETLRWVHCKHRGEMPQLELTYFNARGRAELIRMALACGGIPYESTLLTPEEFTARKPMLPFGQLPVLAVDGNQFGQSYSIAKYVSKLAGLMPDDPLAALAVEQIVDCTEDIRSKFVPIRYLLIGDEEKRDKYREFFQCTLVALLAHVENALRGRDFFCENRVTLADIAVTNLLQQLRVPNCPLQLLDPELSVIGDEVCEGFPGLLDLQQRVECMPQIAAYMATRRPIEHGMDPYFVPDEELPAVPPEEPPAGPELQEISSPDTIARRSRTGLNVRDRLFGPKCVEGSK